MKNPHKVYVPENGELVKFSGYINHVDTSDDRFNRVCFKEDTANRDSGLVSVTAYAASEEGRVDFKKLTNEAKGRFAVVIAKKTTTDKNDKTYENYTLQSIDFAPAAK